MDFTLLPTVKERFKKTQDEDTDERGENTHAENPRVRVILPEMKAKLEALPEGVREKAIMLRASAELKKTGSISAAQELIDRHSSLRGWRVDTELSNTSSLVLSKGGEVKVAYRGTEGLAAGDWHHNARTAVGTEAGSPQMKEAIGQFDRVRAKYGRLPSELLGYSRGGNMAMHLGDLRGVKTTTFNPFVAGAQIKAKSNVEHTIFRTTEDPVSTLLAFTRHKSNYKVHSIQPIVGLHNPKDMHDLKNFTRQGLRQPGTQETMMIESIQKGQQLAHFETLDAMKSGVEQGKTFTQALDDFNRTNGARQNIDVNREGKLGPRIHKQSGTVKYWEASGGTFTDAERAHLRSNPPPPARVVTPEAAAMGIDHEPLTSAQIEHVAGLRPEARSNFMTARRSDLASHTKALTATAKPHENIIRSLMPKTSSITTGVVSGFAAHAVMEGIDPDHHLHPVASEAVEGGLSGAMGAGMMTALGGSAAAGPEVLAGAAAYVAGAESQKAITNAMLAGGADREAAEAVGGVSGGAIGGATAVATGIGATLLSDVVFGTTIGATIGGPIGAAMGAGIGVGIGAVVGGIAYLFGRHGREAANEVRTIKDYARAAAETTDTEERARLERAEADLALQQVYAEENELPLPPLPNSAEDFVHMGPTLTTNEARRMDDILYAARVPHGP